MVANFKRLMVTIHFAIEVTAHLATCQFDDTISHLADITGQLDDSAPTNSVNSLKTSVNSLTTSVNSPTIIFVFSIWNFGRTDDTITFDKYSQDKL